MELLLELIWVFIIGMVVSNLVCCLIWRMMGRRLWSDFFAACKSATAQDSEQETQDRLI